MDAMWLVASAAPSAVVRKSSRRVVHRVRTDGATADLCAQRVGERLADAADAGGLCGASCEYDLDVGAGYGRRGRRGEQGGGRGTEGGEDGGPAGQVFVAKSPGHISTLG